MAVYLSKSISKSTEYGKKIDNKLDIQDLLSTNSIVLMDGQNSYSKILEKNNKNTHFWYLNEHLNRKKYKSLNGLGKTLAKTISESNIDEVVNDENFNATDFIQKLLMQDETYPYIDFFIIPQNGSLMSKVQQDDHFVDIEKIKNFVPVSTLDVFAFRAGSLPYIVKTEDKIICTIKEELYNYDMYNNAILYIDYTHFKSTFFNYINRTKNGMETITNLLEILKFLDNKPDILLDGPELYTNDINIKDIKKYVKMTVDVLIKEYPRKLGDKFLKSKNIDEWSPHDHMLVANNYRVQKLYFQYMKTGGRNIKLESAHFSFREPPKNRDYIDELLDSVGIFKYMTYSDVNSKFDNLEENFRREILNEILIKYIWGKARNIDGVDKKYKKIPVWFKDFYKKEKDTTFSKLLFDYYIKEYTRLPVVRIFKTFYNRYNLVAMIDVIKPNSEYETEIKNEFYDLVVGKKVINSGRVIALIDMIKFVFFNQDKTKSYPEKYLEYIENVYSNEELSKFYPERENFLIKDPQFLYSKLRR